MSRTAMFAMVGAGILVAAATWTIAGDLNPPPGPPAPTMRTNQEIFDAVTTLGTTGAACEPGLPGAVRGLGTITFASLPGSGTNPTAIPIFNFEVTASRPSGGGAVISEVIITKPIDAFSHRLFRACTTGTAITTAEILLATAGPFYYQYILSDVRVTSVRPTLVFRCDGSGVHAEQVRFSMVQLRMTDLATTGFWNWNLQTGMGNGN